MAEEIVTRFTANVDDLKVKIDVATRSLTAVSDAQAKLTAQTNNLAKANKEAAQEEAKATASRQASLAAIDALVNKREDLRQIIVRTKAELKEYNKALEGIKGTGEFEEQKLTAALAKTQEKLVALQALLPKYAAKKRELEKADQAAATAEDQARKATEAARKAYKASFTDLSALIEKEKQLKVATDQTTASIGAQAKTSQGGFAIPPPPPGTTVRPQPGPLGPLPDEDQFANLGAIEGAADAASKKVGDLEAKTRTLVATEQALTTATKEVTKATVEAGANGAPAIDKLTKAEKAATVEAKKLATAQAQIGNTTEGTGAKLSIFGRITQGLSGAFGRIKTSVVEFGRGAKAGFQEAINGVRNLGGGIGAATSSFGTFGSTALGLLGPIGLGVGAVATGLLAVARNTDAGQVAIDGFGRTSGLRSYHGEGERPFRRPVRGWGCGPSVPKARGRCGVLHQDPFAHCPHPCAPKGDGDKRCVRRRCGRGAKACHPLR